MAPSRREALAQLSALFALPLADWTQPPTDPLHGTIADYQAGRLMRRYSAEEITTQALARCRTSGAALRAIDQLASTALAEARASDVRRARGALRGPLDGVPVFAKSIYDMAGLPTTASSAPWARLFPQPVAHDALEVQRLRAAGAVLLGKTAADDFAYRGNGTSSLTGQVRNPHDPTGVYTPGGSSAGAAVVVACGMAFAALGTDDGGSNRIPAQFTGVVGMKPTFGLIPRTGVVPTWPYLDTHGPLARTVADAAAMYASLVGADASDALALTTTAGMPSLRDDALAGVRLGVVETHVPRTQMSSDTLAAFDRALSDCTAAGAIVERFEPSITRVTVRDAFQRAATARGDVTPNANAPAPTANALLRYFEHQFGATAKPRERAMEAVLRGLEPFRAFYDVLPSDAAVMAALATQPYERDPAAQSFARSRREVVGELAAAMKAARVDVMVYPTMPFGAPRAVDAWPDLRTPLGYGNMLGIPEVSVPAGYAASGMPVCNLSFVGVAGDDARVLACAHAYEQRSRRFIAPPSA